MPDHRVTRKPAEFAVEPQQDRPRLRSLELELALAVVRFDAVEPDQEIGLPGGAAVFTIGDGVEADLFLFADQLGDFLVLDRFPRIGVDFAAIALAARLFERRGTQQTADVIGAERRRGAGHGCGLPYKPCVGRRVGKIAASADELVPCLPAILPTRSMFLGRSAWARSP